MIWTIARKEFYNNLITLRFAVGMVLCMFLVILSTHVQMKAYEERLVNYNDAARRHREEVDNVRVYSELHVGIDRSPEVLSILSEGFDRKIGNTAVVRYDEMPAVEESYGRDNPLLEMFTSVDLTLVVQLVLSVLALFMTYDAIAGEKQQGTLRQMLSNSVPRHQILLGKYVGAMMTLVVPLLVTFIMALLMMQLSPSISLKVGDWTRIGLMVVCALIYVSLFALLGMLISSRTGTASLSLVVCLFVWITLVAIVPNAASYAAKYLKPVVSSKIIEDEHSILREELLEKIRGIWKEKGAHIRCSNCGTDDKGLPKYIGVTLKDIARTYIEVFKAVVPLQIRYGDEVWRRYQEYQGELHRQADLAGRLSRISPAFSYVEASSALTGTSLDRGLEFIEGVRRYRRILIQYLYEKKAFSSLLFFTRMEEDEMPEKSWTDEFRNRVAPKKNHPPLDLRDLPRFTFPRQRPTEAVESGIFDLGLLAFWNVVLFMVAFVAFLRYDVR